MKINICVPANDVSAYRILLLLYYHAFSSLGHSVIFSHGQVLNGYFNLFIQHTLFDENQLNALRAGNLCFGYASTENLSATGFGHRDFHNEAEKQHYHNFARACRVVFCHYLDEYEEYSKITDKAVFTPFGFHERIQEIVPAQEKLLDIYFFGSVANEPLRAQQLHRLAQAGFSMAYHEIGASDLMRNSFLAAAKINLNLVHRPTFRHISYRVPWLANNRICPISTRNLDREGYLKYARTVSDEELLPACRQYIDTLEYARAGDEAYERLREDPMTRTLERALDTVRIVI